MVFFKLVIFICEQWLFSILVIRKWISGSRIGTGPIWIYRKVRIPDMDSVNMGPQYFCNQPYFICRLSQIVLLDTLKLTSLT